MLRSSLWDITGAIWRFLSRPQGSPTDGRDGVLLFACGLAVVLALGTVVFPRLGGKVFFSWQSANYVASANEYLENEFGIHLTSGYTQSLGNISALPFNFHLQPEAKFAFINGRIDAVVFYVLATALFYISTFAFGVIAGFGLWPATIAAIAFPLVALPFTSPPLYTGGFWWEFPIFIPIIYLWTATVVSFHFIGRLPKGYNVCSIVAFNAAIIWSMLAYAKVAFVLFLAVLFYCVLLFAACRTRKEAAWKLVGGIVTFAFMLAAGPLDYLRGLYGYTSNGLFADSLQHEFSVTALLERIFYSVDDWGAWLFWANLVWVKYYVGYPLVLLSLIGAAWVLLRKMRTGCLRPLAVAMLLLFPYAFVQIYGSPVVVAVFHVAVLFAVLLVLDAGATGLQSIAGLRPDTAQGIARVFGLSIVACIAAVIVVRVKHIDAPTAYAYPPERTVLIRYLEPKIRFASGDRFGGRFVNLDIYPPRYTSHNLDGRWSSALSLMALAEQTAAVVKNDHVLPGIRHFGIPATVEFNRWATPVSVVFIKYLFGNDDEIDRIDLRVLSRLEPRLMAMIGVRYVMSARDYLASKNMQLVLTQPVTQVANVRLYEIPSANTGDYSPVDVRFASTFAEALYALADPRFDPRQSVLIHRAVNQPTNLVPANAVSIRRVSDGIRVTARSDGRSLLLLPFEFSNCLQLAVASGTDVTVERANLMLTALQFEGAVDVTLRFRFGPFLNSSCRSRDVREVRALGLTAAGLKAFAAENLGRMLFDGFQ